MRGNRFRSFVTRSGQVIRVRAEDIEASPAGQQQQQQPPNIAEGVHEPNGQGQRRPAEAVGAAEAAGAGGGAAGRAAIGGRIDMPRLAAFVLLGIVCAFVIMLAVAGIYRAGKWAFTGKDRAVEVRVESGRDRDMETTGFQKPIPQRPLSYTSTSAGSGVNEVGAQHAVPVQHGHEQAQPGREVETHQQQQAPVVSREPAVDYQSSIREMKKVLDSQEIEIKRLTESLRNMRKGD